jgi:hypothetical protein
MDSLIDYLPQPIIASVIPVRGPVPFVGAIPDDFV